MQTTVFLITIPPQLYNKCNGITKRLRIDCWSCRYYLYIIQKKWKKHGKKKLCDEAKPKDILLDRTITSDNSSKPTTVLKR